MTKEEGVNNIDTLDKLQGAVIEENLKKKKESKYHFDKMRMFFGEDYIVKDIKISQPTIGDILEFGEDRFYNAASLFLNNSTSIRVMLWDYFQKDWNKVKDIEVFDIMSHLVQDKEPLKLIFKDINFDDFTLMNWKKNDEEKLVLYSPSQEIMLFEDDYMEMAEYIREMLNSHPKVEKAKGKTAKSWIIQEDKMNAAKKEVKTSSVLFPLMSACLNHPGFKYKLEELKEVGICQFMDSVNRIQKYESSTAALKGIYSGFVSAKDIGQETLNFMGEV